VFYRPTRAKVGSSGLLNTLYVLKWPNLASRTRFGLPNTCRSRQPDQVWPPEHVPVSPPDQVWPPEHVLVDFPDQVWPTEHVLVDFPDQVWPPEHVLVDFPLDAVCGPFPLDAVDDSV
jgi:hypothetical protein